MSNKRKELKKLKDWLGPRGFVFQITSSSSSCQDIGKEYLRDEEIFRKEQPHLYAKLVKHNITFMEAAYVIMRNICGYGRGTIMESDVINEMSYILVRLEKYFLEEEK